MGARRTINANHTLNASAGPRAWQKKPLAAAISVAVATTGGASAAEIETVIVTATKREESAQDVTVSVQAVTGDTVRELGIETFDEYAEYLPNVVSGGNGPGKRELYIRGSATEQSGVTITAAQGSAPGVALYVDEQPVSFGGRNLDVFAADLERIEVLAGPQGTLFGASSQSGNLRLITRKPEHGKLDAGFNTRFATT
ncbi:MAG: Plug domain-containing protein, partial [Gammaproteobacteria bacterium]|nr:Plug domain-containing protein [Gammaproteobacteria bacterium]